MQPSAVGKRVLAEVSAPSQLGWAWQRMDLKEPLAARRAWVSQLTGPTHLNASHFFLMPAVADWYLSLPVSC